MSDKDMVIGKSLECKLFGGKGSDQYNTLYTAFNVCAYQNGNKGDYAIYDWLDDIPKGSMVVNLVDTLNRLGYKIIKDTDIV